MAMHLVDKNIIINSLKGNIFNVDECSNEDELIIRFPLMNDEEIKKTLQKLTECSDTSWNFYYCNKGATYQMKVYACHLSGIRKSSDSRRNTSCPAKLKVRIVDLTPKTIAKDKFLQQEPPLRTVFTISLKHSHTITTAAALQLLKVSPEIKLKFYAYFEDDLSPGEARSLHEDELLSLQKPEDLANSSKNPTRRQVYNLHEQWRKKQFGPCKNPLEKLKEKIDEYGKEGTCVRLAEGDSWAIAIVTEVMKRAQELPSSKELIFVDSSSSCENTASTVTVLLTMSKSGALPLAVLIHKNQTGENYTKAFRLLKDNFPECFGDCTDRVFMTDDSTAEKNALKEVWPNNEQLLCHFHVAQAEWRWLFSQPDIPLNERPRLMKLFQAVMYADNEAALIKPVQDIKRELNYPKFVARFEKYFERRSEWVFLYRLNLVIRGNNTNNYAEATIRILKDVVLCRTKAYNVVALVHYIVRIYNKYLVKKLLQVAYARERKPYLLYRSLISRTENYLPENIIEVEQNIYLVQSVEENVAYCVNANVGICSCQSGRTGAFCKHQCFLFDTQKVVFPNLLPVTIDERHLLGRLALGEECPPYQFFWDLQPSDSAMDIDNILPPERNLDTSMVMPEKSSGSDSSDVIPECESPLNLQEKIVQEFARLGNLAKDLPSHSAIHFLNKLKSIQTTKDFNKLFVLRSINRTKKIRVQPTSISRRREGLTKKSSRVPSGRPSGISNKKTKRRRCLKENIMLNINNGR